MVQIEVDGPVRQSRLEWGRHRPKCGRREGQLLPLLLVDRIGRERQRLGDQALTARIIVRSVEAPPFVRGHDLADDRRKGRARGHRDMRVAVGDREQVGRRGHDADPFDIVESRCAQRDELPGLAYRDSRLAVLVSTEKVRVPFLPCSGKRF